MKISHIFHHLNDFGGAEEHITSLAELQKSNGHEVCVFLVQSSDRKNQYYNRLKLAGIRVNQWPLWLTRFSGDWDTRESILRTSVHLLHSVVGLVAGLLAFLGKRSQNDLRKSIEGRIRTILGGLIDLRRERRLFLSLLAWRCFIDLPDVFHMHSYGAGLEYVLNWSNQHRIPTVYQEHSTPDLTNRDWYSLPMGLNMAGIIVAVSEASAQALRNHCGVTRPIKIISPIVSINKTGFQEKKSSCWESKEIQIISIARLSEEKGLMYLITAAELVLPIKPSVKFTIYGEGPLRSNLEEMILNKRLSKHIILHGSFNRNELPEIMGKADIFVLPSITEGLPLSIIEAMAWGLPIVATTVGGIPELIKDGVNGLLCEPKNSPSLAQATLSLINDPQRAINLGATARDTFNKSIYSSDYILGQFEEVYSLSLKK